MMVCAACEKRMCFQVRLAEGLVVPVCFNCLRLLEEFDSIRQLPFICREITETRARFIPKGHELRFSGRLEVDIHEG
jgi:hypothetical protein